MATPLQAGFEEAHKRWGWYFSLGIILYILGIIAMSYAFAASLVSVSVFGWLLIGSGLIQAAFAFEAQKWGSFFLHLAGGILEVVVGVLVTDAPAADTQGVTLLLASYLLVGGLFRASAALCVRFSGSTWAVVSGLISFLLGLALWKHWPLSDLWFFGICVGLDLLLHGMVWMIFSMNVRQSLPMTWQEA